MLTPTPQSSSKIALGFIEGESILCSDRVSDVGSMWQYFFTSKKQQLVNLKKKMKQFYQDIDMSETKQHKLKRHRAKESGRERERHREMIVWVCFVCV